MADRESDKKPENPYAQVGLALSIPTLMVSGPLVGYGLGWLIRRGTGWGPWVEWIMLVLGMVAGIRETIRVIRRLS